jgi:RNA polymerase sigma factor (sigma-70 family)
MHIRHEYKTLEGKNTTHDKVDRVSPKDNPEKDAHYACLKLKVEKSLNRLTPQHRAIFHDLYVEGKSVEEIARAFQITAQAVKGRAFQARRHLRGFLPSSEAISYFNAPL